MPTTFETLHGPRTYPDFDLLRLLRTVFVPIEGLRVCILLDLDDPSLVQDLAFTRHPVYKVQKKAVEVFYNGLHNGAMRELGLHGGEIFAYKTTGGSNLDLPDTAVDLHGTTVNLVEAVYKPYDLILCITDFSATAPLTASAKIHGFRGSTLHGLNDIILASGLAVDYNDVSRQAEKLRLGLSGADRVEIDFEVAGSTHTLALHLGGQEAQKSHGLCHGTHPDIANLPAGEVYFVPTGAEGVFPMQYEHDPDTLGLQHVSGGRVVDVTYLRGNPDTIEQHKAKLASDPITGLIGELGFGTQILPFAHADIQDEKTLGTLHVATGRSDHLGGHLVPSMFADASNATHDDILFHPLKTPTIRIPQVRWTKGDRTEIVLRDYKPAPYLQSLLD